MVINFRLGNPNQKCSLDNPTLHLWLTEPNSIGEVSLMGCNPGDSPSYLLTFKPEGKCISISYALAARGLRYDSLGHLLIEKA
jgi:hypothetical protein